MKKNIMRKNYLKKNQCTYNIGFCLQSYLFYAKIVYESREVQLMQNNHFDYVENMAMDSLRISRSMGQKIIEALSKGEIKKELAFELLSDVREQIKNSFNQRIELCSQMKMDPERLENLKRNELESLDAAVYRFSNDEQKLNPEVREQLESLLR